ncbi:MAG: SdrD B-like domain-containing protein [candidate division Zixibacteria bacterium]
MKTIAQILVCISLLTIMLVGCQDDPGIVRPSNEPAISLAASKVTIPAGAVYESAILYVYVDWPNGETTYLHRITGAWEENVVTWGNFGEAYDATVLGSFTATTPGWYSVDVTDLVNGWMTETYENLGVLLRQDQTDYDRITMSSRENAANHPYLDICYSSGDATVCETSETIGDSFIWEIAPSRNHGTNPEILAGWVSGTEKQTLLAFETPEIQQTASLGDYVWRDENINGVQDEGEMGIEGITVHLMDCFGNILAETTTNADGYYLFTDLEPGDYSVHFVAPEGYAFSPMDQGADDAKDSDADPSTGMTGCYTLAAGEVNLTVDAGLYWPPHTGCTLTIGFWKTHAGFGPQDDVVTQYLPIWLGDSGGDKSLEVTDASMAVAILSMKTYGNRKNGITKLYAQLLATKLNIADGSDTFDLGDAVAEADAFLAMYDWTDWRNLSSEDKDMVIDLKTLFDDYNNGDIGPGHCDWVMPTKAERIRDKKK